MADTTTYRVIEDGRTPQKQRLVGIALMCVGVATLCCLDTTAKWINRTGDPLVAAALRHAPPGAVVVAGEPDRPGVPLLADRPLLGGAPTAYVCRGFVCDRPVTAVDDLLTRLRS